jgi:hypothetical protein
MRGRAQGRGGAPAAAAGYRAPRSHAAGQAATARFRGPSSQPGGPSPMAAPWRTAGARPGRRFLQALRHALAHVRAEMREQHALGAHVPERRLPLRPRAALAGRRREQRTPRHQEVRRWMWRFAPLGAIRLSKRPSAKGAGLPRLRSFVPSFVQSNLDPTAARPAHPDRCPRDTPAPRPAIHTG